MPDLRKHLPILLPKPRDLQKELSQRQVGNGWDLASGTYVSCAIVPLVLMFLRNWADP